MNTSSLSSWFRLSLITLISIILLILFVLLSTYILRVALAKRILPDYLPKGAQITCLDFDIGFLPLLSLNELCFETESFNVEMHNANWFLDDWQNKVSRLDIEKLAINQKNTGPETSEDLAKPALPNIAFPAMMPRINVSSLTLASYLLEQPLNIALKQSSPSTFILSGDLNAALDYAEGRLQGTVNWRPVELLKRSKILEEQTQFLHDQLNWQTLIKTQIDSQFVINGDRIESSHSLLIEPQIRLDNCPIGVEGKGAIHIDLIYSNLEARIDLSDFPISADLKQCQLIPAPLKRLKISKINLIATQLLLIKDNALSVSGVKLSLPDVQANPVVTLSNIALGFDQTLSLDYAVEFASNLDALQFDDIALSGALTFTTNGTVLSNDSKWTISSELAKMQIISPASQWGSADRLTNSFNYQVSSSKPEILDFSLSGLQSITGVKTSSEGSSTFKIREVRTDWQMTSTAAESWQIKLINTIPEVNIAQTRLLNLTNITDITTTANSELQLIGQTKLHSISYNDKRLYNLIFDHELKAQLPKMTISGKHTLQLESGVNMQIIHAEMDINILIAEQPVKPLQKLVNQFNSKIQLVAGTFSGAVSGNLSSSNYSGNLRLTDASLKYDDFQVLFLHVDEGFKVNSTGFQLTHGKIKIDEINVGIPIQQVNMVVDIVDSEVKIGLAQGKLIGGEFKVTDLWLDGRKQRSNISVVSLNLTDVVALQQQQGIQLTGTISGILPLQLGTDNVIVKHGLLSSDGPGKLKIQNNPAFDSIKEQQKQLAFLQNVDYRKLSSKIELASDGWLDLELSIAGRNPDVKQEVIFNYGHKENIFTLLKSLRITNTIEDSIEKRIEKRYSEKGK